MILDTAPARSAELLAQDRVDAALVPVIAYQMIDNVRLIPDVCVGAKERVRSVCLITKGGDLSDVRSVALDTSSLTSVALTKIIFCEFLGFEPQWKDAKPNIEMMLHDSDCALMIGDPALMIDETRYRKFDLAEIWKRYTGLGFVFAMWMTRRKKCAIDLADARDEGFEHIDEIVSNYETRITLGPGELKEYLSKNISYSVSDSMRQGMALYFELAQKNGLFAENKPLVFTDNS